MYMKPLVGSRVCRLMWMAHAEGSVTRRRLSSRHGLNAGMARISLRGDKVIDRRTVAAREMLEFRDQIVAALAGEAELGCAACARCAERARGPSRRRRPCHSADRGRRA